jgi:hypothetical protein
MAVVSRRARYRLELVDPAAMHPVRSRQLAYRTPLQHVRVDQIPGLAHENTPSR